MSTKQLLPEKQSGESGDTSQEQRMYVQALKIHQEILDLDAELGIARDMQRRIQLVERIYVLRDLEETIRRKLRDS